DRVSGDDLHVLLHENRRGRVGALVVLAACTGDGTGDVAAFLDGLGARGSLAPLAPLPAGGGAAAGAEFLDGFINRGERVGKVMQRVRGGAAGLSFVAACPANLR